MSLLFALPAGMRGRGGSASPRCCRAARRHAGNTRRPRRGALRDRLAPQRGLLAELPKLEAIFSLGAGVDAILSDPNLPDVPIARIVDPDLTARMSEWVVLHCLMHLRQARRYERQQRERVVGRRRRSARRRRRARRDIGLGELGRDAARKLAALGFQVAAWSASRKRRRASSVSPDRPGSRRCWRAPTFSSACCR